MLLNFTLGNWMSYRDEASLSMISSLERQHGETRSALPGFRNKKVLPVAAVYGGNASGKTALFRGLAALREMVLTDPGVDGLLPVQPFMLDSKSDATSPFLLGKLRIGSWSRRRASRLSMNPSR